MKFKLVITLLFISFCQVLLFSCKKENTNSHLSSTVVVVNGTVDLSSLMVGTNGKVNTVATQTSKINVGTCAFYYFDRLSTNISLFKGTDTSILSTSAYDLSPTTVFSLYVTGQLPNIESFLVPENNFPFIPQDKALAPNDSVINIRFINLSPNTNPLDVKISGAAVNEVTGLAYKSYTAFKAYAAKVVNGVYKFEVRDGTNLLATYTLSTSALNRTQNVALIFRGLKGATGSNSFSVSTVNYFPQ